MKIKNIKSSNTQTVQSKGYKAIKYIWDEDLKETFLECFNSEEYTTQLQEAENLIENEVEASLKKLNDILLQAGKCMKKTCTVGGENSIKNPWFDKECRDNKRAARQALTQVQMIDRNKSIGKFNTAVKAYKERRATYQKLMKEKRKVHKEKIFDNLIKNQNDSAKFWDVIKSIRKKYDPLPQIDIEEWKSHFEKVLNPAGGGSVSANADAVDDNHTDPEDITVDEFLDGEISREEVDRAIDKLKNKKAAGSDGLIPKFIKNAPVDLKDFLVKLFNKLFQDSIFPDEWINSIIIPIFKKGDKANPTNYRGISLQNIMSKVYTSILTERITNWASDQGKICEEQAGFRRNYSTIDHVFTFSQMISNCLYGKTRKKILLHIYRFPESLRFYQQRKTVGSSEQNWCIHKIHE